MAHHAPDPADQSRGFLILPQSNLWRAVVLVAAVAVLGAATLALWATGGLARADTNPKAKPGAEVRTKMYTLTPHKAEFVKDDGGLTALQVSADLVSNDDEPIRVSQLNRTIEVAFPSGKIDAANLTVTYVRHPEGLVSEIQPDMSEKVLMTWALREAEPEDKKEQKQQSSDNPLAGLGGGTGEGEGIDWDSLMEKPKDVAPLAEKEDEVTISFSQNEYAPGFTDKSKRWMPTDLTEAEITFPLGQG